MYFYFSDLVTYLIKFKKLCLKQHVPVWFHIAAIKPVSTNIVNLIGVKHRRNNGQIST